MNLKQFKYVLVLARTGSFSAAAEELNISQPSLSQYIKKIERDLGIELFDRAGGNVRLTDAGRVYIDIGRKMLDLEHRMSVALSDLSENKTGSVIVGTSPYRSASMMPTIAKRFRELYLVQNEGDLVTLLPPALLGFRHAGNIIPIGQKGRYNAIDAHRPESYLAELDALI